MHAPKVLPSPATRVLVRLAVLVLLVGGFATLWELFASQAPSSTYHAGVLPGPVAQLRGTAFVIGISLLVAAWLKPWWSPAREPWWLVVLAALGSSIMLSALAYGATKGVYGLQIDDPREGSRRLVFIRAFGMALLGCSLLEVARRLWFAPLETIARTGAASDASSVTPRSGDGPGGPSESGGPAVT